MTQSSNKSCISRIFCFANPKGFEIGQSLAYSYRWKRIVKSVLFPFVHNRHFPCSHSLRRLFITTPIGCEHSARHLFTRRAAVVHKRWRDSVFWFVGRWWKCITYNCGYIYTKQELWECRISVRKYIWMKIREFWICYFIILIISYMIVFIV